MTTTVVAYAFPPGRGGNCYRALVIDTQAADLRAVLRRVARRSFGQGVTVSLRAEGKALDRFGGPMFGPTGREVWKNGTSFAVWDRGLLQGYVTTYERA